MSAFEPDAGGQAIETVGSPSMPHFNHMGWERSGRMRWVVAGSCFIAMLSISYAVVQHIFYTRQSSQMVRSKYDPEVVGKPLPTNRLTDLSGKMLSDDELRRGKVFLVFLTPDCEACLKEGWYLEPIIDKYKNLRFYGALVHQWDISADALGGKFPSNLKLFVDKDSLLLEALKARAFPLKIYLENGIIRNIWIGTPSSPQVEGKFLEELDEISKR